MKRCPTCREKFEPLKTNASRQKFCSLSCANSWNHVQNILSPRQREVLKLWVLDHSAKEIAVLLGRSENTIQAHISHIHRRLGVSSRIRLLAYAMAHGWVSGRDLMRLYQTMKSRLAPPQRSQVSPRRPSAYRTAISPGGSVLEA